MSNSRLILSASAEAIRAASSPIEAVACLNLRLRGLFPPDAFDSHAAVFTIKSVSSSPSLRSSLTPLLHAYVLKSNLLSNLHVASALLRSYSIFSVADARILFDEILHRNHFTTNTMISCFTRNGDACSARLLFDSCPDKDAVLWSAMITGYMGNHHSAEGLSLFYGVMLQGGLKPDASLLVTILSSCAPTGPMRFLHRSIHAYAVKNALMEEMSRRLGSLLISKYAMAGNLKCALSLFQQIPEKNVKHWTAMIEGLTMHGHAEEAISILQKMRDSGAKPNEHIFITIFNACCDAGLPDQAQKFFAIMVQELGFKPGLYHYGCLVNLFAKAGRLDEAYGVIVSMEVEPNIEIWTSFLEACKKYRMFGMANEGIEKLLSMARPDQHGWVYTLVLELYAMMGRWADTKRVRRLVNQHKVAEVAGPSFMQVDKKTNSAACQVS